MFGAYYPGHPYFAQSPNIDPAQLIVITVLLLALRAEALRRAGAGSEALRYAAAASELLREAGLASEALRRAATEDEEWRTAHADDETLRPF